MREIFAPESKIIAERKLWIAVARAQSQLGHAIPDSVIKDYEKVISKVDSLPTLGFRSTTSAFILTSMDSLFTSANKQSMMV